MDRTYTHEELVSAIRAAVNVRMDLDPECPLETYYVAEEGRENATLREARVELGVRSAIKSAMEA